MSVADADSIEAIFEVQELAFGYRASPERRRFDAEAMDPRRVVVSRDGREVVGVAEWLPSTMSLPGGSLEPVAAVTGVAVRPTHRRQGRLRAMMRRQLDDLHGQGLHIAVLIASESRIYQRFGYGPATLASRYSIDKRGLRLEGSLDPAGRVRIVSPDEARASFPAVFESAQTARPGELGRAKFEWEYLLGRFDKEAGGRYLVQYESAGSVEGYGVYQIRQGASGNWQDRSIRLDELCTLSKDAYAALWSYLISIDLIDKLTTGHRPVDEPIRWALSDYRAMTTSMSGEFTYVRLIDVEEALAKRRYGGEGSLVLAVRDAFCPWNEDTYRLEVDRKGVAQVSRATNAGAELALDASALGSIYLGGLAPSALAEVGMVDELASGALKEADRLFASRRPPFCTTQF